MSVKLSSEGFSGSNSPMKAMNLSKATSKSPSKRRGSPSKKKEKNASPLHSKKRKEVEKPSLPLTLAKSLITSGALTLKSPRSPEF